MQNLTKYKHLTNELSILYIESDSILQKKMTKYLSSFFAKVYQSFDGKEGLLQYKNNKPNIILTDLNLKKKNAFEMIVEIQEMDPNISIIVLSNKNDDFELLENLDLGIGKLLTKPLNVSDLNNELIKIAKNNTKNQICHQAQEILHSATANQTSIKCINSYKGLILNCDTTILTYVDNIFSMKVSKPQLHSILHEKQVIISIDSSFIIGKLLEADTKNNIIKIANPKYIKYTLRSNKNKRIKTDKSFKTSIGYKNIHTELTPIDISHNYIALETTVPIDIPEKSNIELTIGFEINGPSSFINEKKFTKIFATGTVNRIDTTDNKQKLIIELNVKKSGQNVFKQYLQQRELDIINEFKMKMKT